MDLCQEPSLSLALKAVDIPVDRRLSSSGRSRDRFNRASCCMDMNGIQKTSGTLGTQFRVQNWLIVALNLRLAR